jgi:hypothetical protein
MNDLSCKETMSDILCKEIVANISEPYITSYTDKYYSDIIINYINKYLRLENDDSTNKILDNLCDIIAKDITCLKESILALELLIFNTDLYVYVLIKRAWYKSRREVLKKYNFIDKYDYNRLFKFFLLMIHNIPYFLPNDDNVIPGCNHMFDLDMKIGISRKPYKKYYEYKLATNECYNCMRIYNWFNMNNSKGFNCYCENFF